MGGLFSGFGRSTKQEKKPEAKIEPKADSLSASGLAATNSAKGHLPPSDKKPEAANTLAIKPTISKANTNQAEPSKPNTATPSHSTQPNNERSPSMRLSKNTGKPVDNDFDIPADPIAPSYTSSSTSIGTKVEPKLSPCATIGPKISFKGELTGEEDLLVQGKVEGTITLKNNHLIIGKLGTVKANIQAKSITVEGTVEGDIVGQDKIEIKTTSHVNGNLKAERVILEDGAKFKGSIDMGSSISQKAAPSHNQATTTATTAESPAKKSDTV